MKRATAITQQNDAATEARQAINALEERLADVRHLEANLEGIRQAHYACGDLVHQAQGGLYQASTEVGKLETEIRYVTEGRQRVTLLLQTLKGQGAQWEQRAQDAQSELALLLQQEMAGEERHEVLLAQVHDQAQALPTLEDALRSAQRDAHAQLAQVHQHISVEAVEQRNIDQQSRQLTTRRDRLLKERQALSAPTPSAIASLQNQLAQEQEAACLAHDRLTELQNSVTEQDTLRRGQQQRLNDESARLADVSARLHSVKALQERVTTDGKLQPWLKKHGIDFLRSLWRHVHIEQGWENALESALHERLQAIEISSLDSVHALAQDAPPAKLTLYSLPAVHTMRNSASLSCLADLLFCEDASQKTLLDVWLQGCYTAACLQDALRLRGTLQTGETIFVKSGHSVGPNSVSFYAPDSEQAGLLARAQEIEHLDRQRHDQAGITEAARAALVRRDAP